MKYRSEDDKCYGVAGMTIGLSIFDATNLFTGVTLDADGFDCVQFTPDFFFCGNPRLNAKDAWQNMVSHYQISIGLVIANTMCRKMLLDHGMIDRKMRNALFDAVCEEGKALCCLEKDEIEPVFNQYFTHLLRVFSNDEIRSAINEMVQRLKKERSFSSVEVLEMLQELSVI